MVGARVAVITGAAGGIGRALAEQLAGDGYALALVDRDEAGLETVAAALALRGATVTTHVVDLLDRDAPEQLLAEVLATHQGVHLLINNAGISVFGPLEEQSREDVERVLTVNLVSLAQLCRVFTPTLIAHAPADIVNISSFAGVVPFPLQTTYSASKHGVRGLTGGLRIELSDRKVRVHAVLPGTIATALMRQGPTYDEGLSGTLTRLMLDYGTSTTAVAHAVRSAIRWNRAEVVVGWDAHLGICTFAWLPWLVRGGFQRVWAPYRRALARRA